MHSRCQEPVSLWPPPTGAHIPVLDGIRGLAVLMVMFYHQRIMHPTCAADELVVRVAEAGWCGVELFFVLSGFLITGILVESRESPRYFSNFYARRVLRIFPLYYLFVFALVVAGPLASRVLGGGGRSVTGGIWYWTYLSNYWVAYQQAFANGVLDVSWSLAIEEQFYLIWPAVVLLVARRHLAWVCLGVLVLSTSLRTTLSVVGTHPIALYAMSITRLDGLAVGGLIAVLLRDGLLGVWYQRAARGVLLAGLTAVVALFATGYSIDWHMPVMRTVGFLAMALVFGSLLVATLASQPGYMLHRVFSNPALRTFGKYSYALYLFHLPVRGFIRDHLYGVGSFWKITGSPLPGQVVFWVISTLAALGLAMLSWWLLESRFLALKRYFGPGSKPLFSRFSGLRLEDVVQYPWKILATLRVLDVVRYGLSRVMGIRVIQLRPRGCVGKVYLRPRSTDLRVLRQVFCKREMDFTWPWPEPPNSIIDAGANVGYATAMLRQRWPAVPILAIEPDRWNYTILRLTALRVGQVRCIRQGVWTHTTRLHVTEASKRKGDWALQFEPCGEGTPDATDAQSLAEYMDMCPDGRCDLVKIDIEGAEAEVFAGDRAWMRRTRMILVEAHGERAMGAVKSAAREEGFEVSIAGEKLLLCRGQTMPMALPEGCQLPQRGQAA